MTPCKFQTDSTGAAGVLIYSEDRTTVNAIAQGDHAEKIRKALSMPKRLGKAFAMAEVADDGQILLGDRLPEQFW